MTREQRALGGSVSAALCRLCVLLAVASVCALGQDFSDASESDTQRCYRLRELISLDRHDEALRELEKLHALGRKRGDYRGALKRVIDRISPSPYNMALLDRLVAAHPKHALPLLVRGSKLISYAWVARGSGYANTVSDEAFKLLAERIELAGKDLDLAQSLDPKLALVSATQIVVARAQGAPEAEVRAIFKRATQADPACYTAYRSMLEYLKPKWHGSERAMLDFAKRSVAEHPKAVELRMLQVDAWLEQIPHGGVELNAYLARTPAARRRLREAWDAVIEAYPRATEPLRERLVLARGVTKEDDQPYVRALALAGMEDSQYELGYGLLESDPQEAIGWFEVAALGGNPNAAAGLSNYYTLGQHGLPIDPQASTGWLGCAARWGLLDAQRQLGMRFLQGKGVARDATKACYWFKRAALRGDGKAMNSYAISLATGQGTPRDQKLAFDYFVRAAEAGSTAALVALGGAYEQGQVGPGPNPYRIAVDLRRALGYYRRAAERGSARGRQLHSQLLAKHPELR